MRMAGFRLRLLVFMTSVVVMISLISGYATLTYRQAQKQTDAAQKAAAQRLELANRILYYYQEQNLAWANLLVRGQDPAHYHHYLSDFYQHQRRTAESTEQLLRQLQNNETLLRLTRQFMQELSLLRQAYRQALHIFNESKESLVTTDRFLSAATKEPTEELRNIVKIIKSEYETTSQNLNIRLEQKEVGILVFSIVVILFSLILIVWFVDANFAKPLTRAIGTARDVAAGKIGERINVKQGDEFGVFAESFNYMLEKLTSANVLLEDKIVELREEISRREAIEQELRKQQQSLTSINKELESFSYSVSHDLRAPLRGIDGFSQTLIEDYAEKLDETGKDYLQRVRASTKRMSLLINDLLMLSQVTRAPMSLSQVDVSALAQESIAQLREQHPEREVIVDIAPGLHTVADRGLLKAAFDNLIGNAWKYTVKRPDAHIEINGVTQSGENVIYVRDNGVGFNMRYADRLFNAFHRLHSPEEFEGSGIGLATVQRIVRRHGGRIWCESEPDKGATFYLTLANAKHNKLSA